MTGVIGLVSIIGGSLLLILILRAIGAWMLRIDEVIRELKEIKEELRKGKEKMKIEPRILKEKAKGFDKPLND